MVLNSGFIHILFHFHILDGTVDLIPTPEKLLWRLGQNETVKIQFEYYNPATGNMETLPDQFVTCQLGNNSSTKADKKNEFPIEKDIFGSESRYHEINCSAFNGQLRKNLQIGVLSK